MRKIQFILLALLLALALSACGGEGSNLEGKWRYSEWGEVITFDFKSDGTFIWIEDGERLTGTYTTEDGNLILDVVEYDDGEYDYWTETLTYEIKGKNLTFGHPFDGLAFTKQ